MMVHQILPMTRILPDLAEGGAPPRAPVSSAARDPLVQQQDRWAAGLPGALVSQPEPVDRRVLSHGASIPGTPAGGSWRDARPAGT